MMNVSLQFIVHFEVLNGMPTAGELAFAIMWLSWHENTNNDDTLLLQTEILQN